VLIPSRERFESVRTDDPSSGETTYMTVGLIRCAARRVVHGLEVTMPERTLCVDPAEILPGGPENVCHQIDKPERYSRG
jgi:hypothetical protein